MRNAWILHVYQILFSMCIKRVWILKLEFKMTCGVCGEQASGYFNYGGPSCSSCRVFFRRMSIKYRIDPCIYQRNCLITIKTRRSCQHCRYLKCLQNGMDPTKIKLNKKVRINTQSMKKFIVFNLLKKLYKYIFKKSKISNHIFSCA